MDRQLIRAYVYSVIIAFAIFYPALEWATKEKACEEAFTEKLAVLDCKWTLQYGVPFKR